MSILMRYFMKKLQWSRNVWTIFTWLLIKLIIMEGGLKILEKSVNKVCLWIDPFGLCVIYLMSHSTNQRRFLHKNRVWIICHGHCKCTNIRRPWSSAQCQFLWILFRFFGSSYLRFSMIKPFDFWQTIKKKSCLRIEHKTGIRFTKTYIVHCCWKSRKEGCYHTNIR